MTKRKYKGRTAKERLALFDSGLAWNPGYICFGKMLRARGVVGKRGQGMEALWS